ncbi:hypothetical protein JKP88DRAFT_323187 [Tribonema minus]|uniref:F-box domain-containing protein n=1 Tax=Tribonema minus TaxID=303371 RepID=A0A835YSX1_9STRA|nr:hypothetical protein JKP88DRAFT_323187 [Tribonema minus]
MEESRSAARTEGGGDVETPAHHSAHVCIDYDGFTQDTMRRILQYLDAIDLSGCASTSRAFASSAGDASLWKRLLLRDFTCVADADVEADVSHVDVSHPRASYAVALAARRQRIIDARLRQVRWRKAEKQEAHQMRVGTCLDILHVRLLSPLLCLAPIATLLMLGRWMDGVESSYWIMMVPMWTLLGVLALASATAIFMWVKSSDGVSLYRDMFRGMRGFVWFFIHRVFEERTVGVLSGVALLVLVTLTLVLIGLKLQEVVAAGWFAVLAPLWAVFMIICLSPCLRWSTRQDPACYTLAVLLCWLPLLTTALMAAAHLDYGEPGLPAVMAPLWVVQGVCVCVALGAYASVAIRWLVWWCRKRRLASGDNRPDLANFGHLPPALSLSVVSTGVIAVLCLLMPLVLFEVSPCDCNLLSHMFLLVAYVYGNSSSEHSGLSATALFVPLLLFCALFAPALLGLAVSYRTRHRATALQWVENPLNLTASFANGHQWTPNVLDPALMAGAHAGAQGGLGEDSDSEIFDQL